MPNPALQTDPAYHSIYGQAEFTFFPPNCLSQNQLGFDVTAVDYFGLPIQFTLQPHGITSGIFQTRHTVIEDLRASFNSALSTEARVTWNQLILTEPDGGVLRILSPGEGLFGPGGANPLKFDPIYFDNKLNYTYSWAENVWTGPNAYYKQHQLGITTSTILGKKVFIGKVQADNYFYFIYKNEIYKIPWLTSSTPANSTSASLFNVSNFLPGTQYSSNGGKTYCTLSDDATAGCLPNDDAKELTKIFSSAIIAGIIPGKTDKLTNAGPSPALVNLYYQPNQDLPNSGAFFGPWFDLYSKGLIGTSDKPTGNIVYAYPYDDYLYSNSPILDDVAVNIATITPDMYIIIQVNNYSPN